MHIPEVAVMATRSLPRVPWIDHLRTAVIILVVNLHACVTYSHVGDWYFMSEPEPTLAAKVPFILWEGHLQAFFMGLLFFISGYCAHGALVRRGATPLIRERLVRLGLPALFYMLAIHPSFSWSSTRGTTTSVRRPRSTSNT